MTTKQEGNSIIRVDRYPKNHSTPWEPAQASSVSAHEQALGDITLDEQSVTAASWEATS